MGMGARGLMVVVVLALAGSTAWGADALWVGYNTTAARKATCFLSATDVPNVTGTVTFTGNVGSQNIAFSSGSSADTIKNAINAKSHLTGVTARRPSATAYLFIESRYSGNGQIVDITPTGMAVFNAVPMSDEGSSPSVSDTDLNSTALWRPRAVPGSDARAVFNFEASSYKDDLQIVGAIAPGAISLTVGDNVTVTPTNLQKNLSMNSLKLSKVGGTSVPTLFRVGNVAEKASLRMSTSGVAAVTGYTLISGPAGTASVDFTGLGGNGTGIVSAINAVSASTGVVASGTTSTLTFESQSAGDYLIRFSEDLDNPGGVFTTLTKYSTPSLDGADRGLAATTATLTLTGTDPLDLTEGSATGSACLFLSPGSKLVMNGAVVNIAPICTSPWSGLPVSTMAGGSTGGGSSGSIDFANDSGSGVVNLANPWKRGEGLLNIGYHQLRAHSTVTFSNPSGIGFIRMATVSGGKLVDSIDGWVLNRMDEVPFYVDTGDYSPTFDVLAGDYQSIHSTGSSSWNVQTHTFRLMGDVNLKGLAVYPGNAQSSAPPTYDAYLDSMYGLILQGGGNRRIVMNLNGNILTAERGVLLKRAGASSSQYHDEVGQGSGQTNREGHIDATNSVLVVKGDLEFKELYNEAGSLCTGWTTAYPVTKLAENRGIGIKGGATTRVVLHGSFKTNTRSLKSTLGGMDTLTFDVISGSESAPNTFEVGADPSNDFVAGTYCIGELNIGDGAVAGWVRLVNDSLNDNDAANIAKTKDGEVLLVKSLNIRAGSVLDCDGQGVKISSSSLNISPTGILDLHTGQAGTLPVGVPYTKFFGMGDQTLQWNVLKDNVGDSSNPTLDFEAVTTTIALGSPPVEQTVTAWQPKASGGVLEIAGASVSPDWAFQNTASTVVNVHYGLLTVTVNDTYGNTSYTVTVTKTAGPGEVTVAATANDLEKRLYGSLRTDGITGTGTCQFSVQVVGDVGGDVTGPVSTTFKVRRLGDINDDNAVTTDDSVWLTKKLNNLDVTPLVARDFDVTGDGFVTTDDDVLLTKILNNLAIP